MNRRGFALRTILALAAMFPVASNAQEKPDREATIKYINNVIAKAKGASITQTSQFGPMLITYHSLSYDKDSKSYRTHLTEELNTTVEGYRAWVQADLSRWGWSLRNLDKIEDLPAEGTTELRRIKVSFTSGSVRQKHTQRIVVGGREQPTKTLTDETIGFITFFYRSSDPDDAKRLRNATLRLKELDDEEKDPFLK